MQNEVAKFSLTENFAALASSFPNSFETRTLHHQYIH